MAANPDLKKLIGIPYKLKNGPDLTGVIDPWREGINCQYFTHLALGLLFQVRLPSDLLSREIFFDNQRFTAVDDAAKAKLGDIFLFGRQAERDYRCLHLALLAEAVATSESGESLLIHATSIEGKVCFWPLSAFSNYPRYQKLFAIKRLRGMQ